MKKILFAIPVILFGIFITPAHAGSAMKTNNLLAKGKKNKASVHERKIKNNDWANYQTVQQFDLDFPHATHVTWHERNFAEATFKDGFITKTAYYDNDNSLVGTTTKASYSALPKNAKTEIKKDYPGYKVNAVIFFKDNEDNDTDMFLYSQPFEDADNYFAEINNGTKNIVLKIDMNGMVTYFQTL